MAAALTTNGFDDLARQARGNQRVVGSRAIGAVLGFTSAYVGRLARDPANKLPVTRLGHDGRGTYVADLGELRAWLRQRQAQG